MNDSMRRPIVAFLVGLMGLGLLAVIVAVVVGGGFGHRDRDEPVPTELVVEGSSGRAASPTDGRDLLYGRVTTIDGASFEGRLRAGGDEEASWSDFFNGTKAENPWRASTPPDRLTERVPVSLFGVEITERERAIDLERPFMVRYGDIRRIDVEGASLRVTLRSGTVHALDRLGADDIADGLRVWDRSRGVVDLGELRLRAIELLPTPPLDDPPRRLYGTVRTSTGSFTGSVGWNRHKALTTDALVAGETSIRLGAVRAVVRDGADKSRIELVDGREIVLGGAPDVGRGHRGVTVDDPRIGRVLVPWDAFERVDFDANHAAPTRAYDDFLPGRPLTGRVTTRAGQTHDGRLVFDLDESETVETLDAPRRGVNYTVPFARIRSIVPAAAEGEAEDGDSGPLARIVLSSGEELRLEREGDLGDGNAGVLVFDGDARGAVHVRWSDIARVDFSSPTR